MKTVVLATIFGDRLNLNGDQANLFVLSQRLKWAGYDSQTVSISSTAELRAAEPDFLFLGHGSLAAWQSCEDDWRELASDFLEFAQHRRAMAIGSGADRALSAAGFDVQTQAQQLSEFCVDEVSGLKILGYKNTRTVNSESVLIGSALLTWLHGPVLAKNPLLADRLIGDLVVGTDDEELKNGNTRKIDQIVAGVWQLESPAN